MELGRPLRIAGSRPLKGLSYLGHRPRLPVFLLPFYYSLVLLQYNYACGIFYTHRLYTFYNLLRPASSCWSDTSEVCFLLASGSDLSGAVK